MECKIAKTSKTSKIKILFCLLASEGNSGVAGIIMLFLNQGNINRLITNEKSGCSMAGQS